MLYVPTFHPTAVQLYYHYEDTNSIKYSATLCVRFSANVFVPIDSHLEERPGGGKFTPATQMQLIAAL